MSRLATSRFDKQAQAQCGVIPLPAFNRFRGLDQCTRPEPATRMAQQEGLFLGESLCRELAQLVQGVQTFGWILGGIRRDRL